VEVNLRGLRVGVLIDHLEGREMEAAVRASFDAVCARLSDAGAIVQPVVIPHLDLAMDLLLTLVAPEASAFHAQWLPEHAEQYAPLTRMQLELGYVIPGMAYVRAQQFRRLLAREFLRAFEDVDALLSPTAPWVAPQEDPAVAGDEGAAEGRWTAPYNLTGLPALTVPCGFSEDGLPIGLQIGTRPYADALALRIGAAVESLMPEVASAVRRMAAGQVWNE
jgi:aspartyl-tRNA(Asn)/glutamyl-tRNA(Gln) amidotransferase subunit A